MTLALLGLLATVNPAAAALALTRDRRGDRPLPAAGGAVIAVLVLVALAAGADAFLDALDINLGTYRLGAGVVILVVGLRWLVAAAPSAVDEPTSAAGLSAFVAFPVLVTPGAAALVVSIGAEDGIAPVLVGAVVAAILGALAIHRRRSFPAALATGATRLLGALAVVIGIIVAVDGIRTL